MITLTGTYADECNGPLPDVTLKYACRIHAACYGEDRHLEWVNSVGEKVSVMDGDALKVCGGGTWFAHYTPDGTNHISRAFMPPEKPLHEQVLMTL